MADDPLDPLRQALGALPPERHRGLRPFIPLPGAGLGPANLAGAPLLDLASNDYLGFSQHPRIKEAACRAINEGGVGAGASRLVSGSRPQHGELEERLATWLKRGGALVFPSGFQANIAAVCALADRHSLVLADRLLHHSLLVGVKACGARLRRYAHNDLNHLEQLLAKARSETPKQRLLVISESLFSMEGTSPDLPALADLCISYGALLLIDEAHAIGVLGAGGRGLAHGLKGVSLVSGTFGKALGSGGAFLCGEALVVETLLQFSGAFRYSTALAPPLAAAALEALNLLQEQPQLAETLRERCARWRQALTAAGWSLQGDGPILPLVVGDDGAALELQRRLESAGLLSMAIRPPTVPEGTARLRLVLRNDLPQGTLKRLLEVLGSWG